MSNNRLYYWNVAYKLHTLHSRRKLLNLNVITVARVHACMHIQQYGSHLQCILYDPVTKWESGTPNHIAFCNPQTLFRIRKNRHSFRSILLHLIMSRKRYTSITILVFSYSFNYLENCKISENTYRTWNVFILFLYLPRTFFTLTYNSLHYMPH